MNYSELQTAIMADTHRENYAADIPRFIQQGEGLIRSRLEAYGLEYMLTDADRTNTATPVYTLPARVSVMKQIVYNNMVLDQVDETTVAQYRSAILVMAYAMRATTVIFGGVPPANAQLQLIYMGMPATLSAPTDTNALLNDYPQLYIDAASVYVFRRAQDYDSAQAAFTSANSLIEQINRKMHKQIAGARPSNAYNVSYRSSY